MVALSIKKMTRSESRGLSFRSLGAGGGGAVESLDLRGGCLEMLRFSEEAAAAAASHASRAEGSTGQADAGLDGGDSGF